MLNIQTFIVKYCCTVSGNDAQLLRAGTCPMMGLVVPVEEPSSFAASKPASKSLRAYGNYMQMGINAFKARISNLEELRRNELVSCSRQAICAPPPRKPYCSWHRETKIKINLSNSSRGDVELWTRFECPVDMPVESHHDLDLSPIIAYGMQIADPVHDNVSCFC